MNHSLLVSILILSPFIGFLINGLGSKKLKARMAGSIGTIASFVSFFAALFLFIELSSLPPEARRIFVNFFEWINVANFKVDASFVVDPISSFMILIVTGVGSLIHLFSMEYMRHDEGIAKYFSFLNLFMFNMLLLVLGSNLLIMFVGWEGVGLCSYLLIGFWYKDKEKAAAGMKAFVTNRVGDAAFLLGIFILFLTYGTLNFQELNLMAPAAPELSFFAPLTLGTLMLFIGATGKSAQIPLYIWLPDAMAGPTPVSALIHAATMVTAGIYMIVRLNFIFAAAPITLMCITFVGALTALLAASIALTQWDIKKILAYSTVSQLGYMFVACGVGAFDTGLFHLMTHAFFKALLFLGAGSVIHALHEEQDIRRMGGLRKYLPITHGTFFVAWLAILGVPPFSGFFSKDEILSKTFLSPYSNKFIWFICFVTAVLTAFYMTRLMAMVFWGSKRFDEKKHPHEAPPLMAISLIVLAIFSFFAGWLGVPSEIREFFPFLPENILEHWFSSSIKAISNFPHGESSLSFILMGLVLGSVMLSAYLAYHFYVISILKSKKVAEACGPIYRVLFNKYYIDEAYNKVIINPIVKTSKALWFYIEINVIDKITYLLSDIVKSFGQLVRTFQNGNIQIYAMYFVLGIVVTLSYLLMR